MFKSACVLLLLVYYTNAQYGSVKQLNFFCASSVAIQDEIMQCIFANSTEYYRNLSMYMQNCTGLPAREVYGVVCQYEGANNTVIWDCHLKRDLTSQPGETDRQPFYECVEEIPEYWGRNRTNLTHNDTTSDHEEIYYITLNLIINN